MTRVERAVEDLRAVLAGKDVLEVACGCAEFSLCAAGLAASVHCIDLDAGRLLPEVSERVNIIFSKMDASAMTFPDASFDTAVMYNAVGHLVPVLERTVDECLRVLRPGGSLHVVSSFLLDRRSISGLLLPLLERKSIKFRAREDVIFSHVQISA